ncbi:helix-turn-helix domain-containing protein [Leucobacter chromiiresistens]|uniref:Helix-turn-helix domain-containing protein n=1 Tax=Leucobacter chromiiresistens TaxID=1079994 RepID=A0A147EN54_9MICO|nr:cupin domain-containing protein [Leucobacter chromiiresistens]KTR85926.1 transcriptional regulator [Leucobacter chromiiresistens]SDQ06809.1 Helix-turn-helix domain-containing protein [Leucobacter chromiiresistens]
MSADDALELGRRVAALREVRGMSLRALAAGAGVSSSFLSQLENARTNASVASLRKIAIALGVSPAQLLDDKLAHTRGVLRAADRPTLPLEGADKYVLSLPPLRNLEVYAGHFAPGGSTGADFYTHGQSQEMLVVTAGEIVLELGDDRYTLRADDSIEFLSSVPHRVVNESSAPASVIWINSPPTPVEDAHTT